MSLLSNPQTRTTLPSAALLFASWVLIAIPIAVLDPSWFNQDTYQYLGLANYYLETPVWHIRDAGTVGPVIPALLAILKWLVTRVVPWTPNVDIAILKGAALACYMTISLAAVEYHEKKGTAARESTAFLIGLMLFCFPFALDAFCLNGELVCMVLLALVFVISAKPHLSRTDEALVIGLGVLIIYTKLQAVLILGTTFMTCFEGKTRRRIIVGSVLALSFIDLWLFRHEAGWLYRLALIATYVGGGHVPIPYPIGTFAWGYTAIVGPASTLRWVFKSTLDFFPLATAAVLVATVKPMAASAKQSLILWLAVYVASVAIPGRPFQHYILFFIPVAFLFTHVALENVVLRRPSTFVAVGILGVLAIIRFCTLVPDVRGLGGDRILGFIPPQFISEETKSIRESYAFGPHDTLLVHGWDYRYYSYFNKGIVGPDLESVYLGLKSKETYIEELVAAKPTFIFDITNHTGVLYGPAYAIESNSIWARRINAVYRRVYSRGGLVIYCRKDAAAKK